MLKYKSRYKLKYFILNPVLEMFHFISMSQLVLQQMQHDLLGNLGEIAWTRSTKATDLQLKKLFEASNKGPLETERKLNVHKSFRRCLGRYLNILYIYLSVPCPGEREWTISNKNFILTHFFIPLLLFYIPWQLQKTSFRKPVVFWCF